MAAKILLVEDDTNLSEIYKARLEAEGFDVVAGKDGEEALALAVKEHPNLMICDVMMPKISGFDMLDILRGIEGIKDTKIIMMTALGQSEDKARAKKLGADRYLVKSQVTLEDMVKVVHEVLEGKSSPTTTQDAGTDNTQTSSSVGGESIPNPSGATEPTVAKQVSPTSPQPLESSSTSVPGPSPVVDQAIANDEKSEESDIKNQIKKFIESQSSDPTASQAQTTDGEDDTTDSSLPANESSSVSNNMDPQPSADTGSQNVVSGTANPSDAGEQEQTPNFRSSAAIKPASLDNPGKVINDILPPS